MRDDFARMHNDYIDPDKYWSKADETLFCDYCMVTVESDGSYHHEAECITLEVAKLQASIRELEASRDQYQEWAIDYERRISKAKAILEEALELPHPARIERALAALEGKC